MNNTIRLDIESLKSNNTDTRRTFTEWWSIFCKGKVGCLVFRSPHGSGFCGVLDSVALVLLSSQDGFSGIKPGF